MKERKERKRRAAIFKCLSETGQNPHVKQHLDDGLITESLTPPSPDLPPPPSLGYYIFSLNLTFRCLPACVLKTSAGTTRSAPTSTQPHLHEAPTCWWSWRGVASVFSNDAAFASQGVIRYQTQSCGAEPTLLLHSFTLCPARGVHGLLPAIACDFRVFG